jgi:hypothetical protein
MEEAGPEGRWPNREVEILGSLDTVQFSSLRGVRSSRHICNALVSFCHGIAVSK